MYKIQYELKQAKEEIKKWVDKLSKVKNLNEELISEIEQLKQGKSSKGNWKKDNLREELRKRDE